MGRYNTGAWTTKECRRITIKHLRESGLLIKNATIQGTLSWNDDSKASFMSVWNEEEIYLELSYVVTRSYDGSKHNVHYKIPIVKIPSNLGKGYLLYFWCPFANRKAKILYQAYRGLYYKSRYAYQYHIYYPSQICSKRFKGLEMSIIIDDKLQAIRGKYRKSHYRGKLTKTQKRIAKLEQRLEYYEQMNSREFSIMLSRFPSVG